MGAHVDFDFAFDPRFEGLLGVVAGARPDNSRVRLTEDRLRVHFGRFHLSTPLDNVRDVEVTRGYRWYRAIGPRLSLADRGATYGSNENGGVCICFHDPVRALPIGRSPALTVTVADLDGLAAALRDAMTGPRDGV